MGIKGLWNILTPYSEKKSLHEIRGETVAVDLSGWVCDSQNVTDYHIQPKLYLRTIYLLLGDVNPIFVLEGDAPELKQDVMAMRNNMQFRGTAAKADKPMNKKPDVTRKRFKGVLKECESLLKCMGVRCIKGSGEAEATCAELNAQRVVDAVISQDSDCFAYGAQRVYRNFSVASAAGGGAMQGSIECYDAEKMFRDNGFGRNKMIALALLCGCDYGVGACGSSINTVVSFLHTVPDNDVIPRLLSWVSDPEDYEKKNRWLSVPGRCDRCGHSGRTHGKNGCPVCVTDKGCHDTGHKSKVAEIKKELSLRTRALSCGLLFPDPRVMKEFLNSNPEKINIEDLKFQPPSLIKFVQLMSKKLDWSERYCVEKFLPLLTKWHLQDNVPCRTIKPIKINKKRNPRGVPSYEVVWSDVDGQYEALIPDDQYQDGEDCIVSWTSTERQDLMQRYYPSVVEAYEESVKKPPKVKKTRKKNCAKEVEKPKRKYNKKVNINRTINKDNSTNNVKSTDHNASKVGVKINKLKRKILNSAKTKGQKTLYSFVANKRRKSNKSLKSLRLSFKNMSILNNTNENIACKTKPKDLLEILNMSDDTEEDINLSEVVDKIVSNAPTVATARVHNKLVKLIFDNKSSIPRKSFITKDALQEMRNNCSTPNESPIRRSNIHIMDKSNDRYRKGNTNSNKMLKCSVVRTSNFFDKLTEDRDAFEMSLEYNTYNNDFNDLDGDKTVDYSLPDVYL